MTDSICRKPLFFVSSMMVIEAAVCEWPCSYKILAAPIFPFHISVLISCCTHLLFPHLCSHFLLHSSSLPPSPSSFPTSNHGFPAQRLHERRCHYQLARSQYHGIHLLPSPQHRSPQNLPLRTSSSRHHNLHHRASSCVQIHDQSSWHLPANPLRSLSSGRL
jgi:hypothetical protein